MSNFQNFLIWKFGIYFKMFLENGRIITLESIQRRNIKTRVRSRHEETYKKCKNFDEICRKVRFNRKNEVSSRKYGWWFDLLR